jgi:hypothetical protein
MYPGTPKHVSARQGGEKYRELSLVRLRPVFESAVPVIGHQGILVDDEGPECLALGHRRDDHLIWRAGQPGEINPDHHGSLGTVHPLFAPRRSQKGHPAETRGLVITLQSLHCKVGDARLQLLCIDFSRFPVLLRSRGGCLRIL